MSNCFEQLVGLARSKDCNCNAPDGTDTVSQWTHQIFTTESPANPVEFTTDYTLPASLDDVQVFENGVRVADGRLGGVGTTTLSIDDPEENSTYQIWYLADVPATLTIPAYDTSQSGLYLSDLLPETELRGLENCDRTVWQVHSQSRSTAIGEFIASMNASIKKKTNEKHPRFSGFIGAPDGTGYLSSTSDFTGVRFRTNPIKSGYLRINNIMTIFEKTGTIDVTVFSGDGTIMTPTFTLRTIAGRKCINEVGLRLPLLGDFNHSQDYYFVYDYDANNRPLLNKSWCGCTGTMVPVTYVDHFGHSEWMGNYKGRTAWNNYIIAGGFEADTLSEFSDQPVTVSQYMNGLAFDIEIGCDITAGLCKMLEGGGPEVQAAATFIQRTSAGLSVNKKNISSIPDRDNIAKGEEQASQAGVWFGEAAEAMDYLTSEVNDSWNDCVLCRPKISMGSILT